MLLDNTVISLVLLSGTKHRCKIYSWNDDSRLWRIQPFRLLFEVSSNAGFAWPWTRKCPAVHLTSNATTQFLTLWYNLTQKLRIHIPGLGLKFINQSGSCSKSLLDLCRAENTLFDSLRWEKSCNLSQKIVFSFLPLWSGKAIQELLQKKFSDRADWSFQIEKK